MAKSVYEFVRSNVEPLEEFLKAVVEVNARRMAAEEAGWNIVLSIHGSNESLSVSVERDEWDSLPTED